eukprot:372286_1
MMVDHRLRLTFWSKNIKVEQVVKTSMDTFILFTMENKLRFEDKNYLTHVQLCFFRRPQYAPDYNQNFCRRKYFAIYAATIYSMIPTLLVLLEVIKDIIETYGLKMKGNIIALILEILSENRTNTNMILEATSRRKTKRYQGYQGGYKL